MRKKTNIRHSIHFGRVIVLLLATTTARPQHEGLLRLVQTIPLPAVKGRIDHLDADVKGRRLFIAALENNSLEVVDLNTGKRIQSIPGFKKPQGVAYVPELNKLFVASGDDGMLRVFRGDTLQLLTAIQLDRGANRVAYDPRRKILYAGYGGRDAGKDYGETGIIDAKTDKHIGDIKVAAHPAELLLDASGQKLFVLIPLTGQIQVIDTRKHEVVATWAVKSQRPGDAAFDESTHRLMVGTRAPPTMTVVNSDSGEEKASLPTVGGMDGVYFDSLHKRIYVSGGGASSTGSVFVYKQNGADQYEFLQEMPTRTGASTALWAPELNRYYVAAPAGNAEEAAILVYEPHQ
jgi:DNA-binding beta-propeller fold protein YncE